MKRCWKGVTLWGAWPCVWRLGEIDNLVDFHEGQELSDIGLYVSENEGPVLLTGGLDTADEDAYARGVDVFDIGEVERDVARAGRELERENFFEFASIGHRDSIDINGFHYDSEIFFFYVYHYVISFVRLVSTIQCVWQSDEARHGIEKCRSSLRSEVINQVYGLLSRLLGVQFTKIYEIRERSGVEILVGPVIDFRGEAVNLTEVKAFCVVVFACGVGIDV